MGIGSVSDYVQFYSDLGMKESVSLQSFVNNEKLVLKGKLENKNMNKDKILKGIDILNLLKKEIEEIGEEKVLKKYAK